MSFNRSNLIAMNPFVFHNEFSDYENLTPFELSTLLSSLIEIQANSKVYEVLAYCEKKGLVKEVLCAQDAYDEYLYHLHKAIDTQNLPLVHLVLDYIKKYADDAFKTLMLCQDRKVLTPLHHVCQTANFDLFMVITNALGSYLELAVKSNNCADYPISLIPNADTESSKKMINCLMDCIHSTENIKDLKALINIEQILEENCLSIYDNNDLINNLNIGCQIVNWARSIVDLSTTHPSVKLNTEMYKFLEKEINDIRDKPWNEMIALTKQKRIANCDLYSYLIYDELTKVVPNLLVEVFSLDDDDHQFVVIGRDPNSKSLDFTTWGDQAVIVDAWAGEVYPASAIPQKMRGFGYIEDKNGKVTNFTKPYDDFILVKLNPNHLTCSQEEYAPIVDEVMVSQPEAVQSDPLMPPQQYYSCRN